ncbi:hypothetical protein TELCIR_05855 [Teladorsagia circumcincta]|uniref:Uncharacterized protein n=1 Tax=Teladorsagia circumcincta TaxID=45464 RepID=A0A2G9UPZ6_TELCI|nr:hypothetical protein TELCIR_05855 [Teladorsagia circumcincta]
MYACMTICLLDKCEKECDGKSSEKPQGSQRAREVSSSEDCMGKYPQEKIDKLIESMPRRCQAVIDAKGFATKY